MQSKTAQEGERKEKKIAGGNLEVVWFFFLPMLVVACSVTSVDPSVGIKLSERNVCVWKKKNWNNRAALL